MNRICVFCGSSAGARPEYLEAAAELGQCLARKGVGLVYGGGRVGMMGKIAATVIDCGGDVIGVIPEDLARREVAFSDLPDLRIVDSMHARKALMVELSDGFILLPGGLGTMEEFFEMLTWGQLGIHKKPCGLLDVQRYFGKLVDLVAHTVAEKFVDKENLSMILMNESPEKLLRQFENYRPPAVDKAKWTLQMANAG